MVKGKKLVYVLHSIAVGGIEVALLSAIPKLYKEYDLTVIVLGSINQELISHFSEDERNVFKTFDYPKYLFPFKIRKVIKYIRSVNPDQVVCSLWRASWIGIKLKKKLPNIRFYSFIHSTNFFHLFDSFFTRKAIQMADIVLVDSESSLKFVKDKAKSTKEIRKVSFLTHQSAQCNWSGDMKTDFGDRKIKFLFIGRITRVKNVPLVIRFISLLKEKSYNVSLDIYGRPDNDYQTSIKLVKELGLENDVTFKGEINPKDRFKIFKDYDFYIHLSTFEGMAMSVAEAMQNGLVCIVTPVGEIPNYSKDGDSAIFVDKNDIESSFGKLEAVIKDTRLYDYISKNCYKNFSCQKCYSDSLIENLS